MGGRHVAMVAADYPHVVRKIVIVDTPAELPPNLLAMRDQQTETDAVPDPETFETFEEVIANGLAQYPLTPESELRHANYHNLISAELRRLNRHRQVDLYAYLRRVRCPPLLVRGQSSPLLTSEVAQKMVEVLPEARVVEVANAAHTVNADNAEAFNRVAAAFIQE